MTKVYTLRLPDAPVGWLRLKHIAHHFLNSEQLLDY